MTEEEIPDKNIFMMCETLNLNALTELSGGYSIRNCKPDELDIWKAMPFDSQDLARAYDKYMTDYFNMVYGEKKELFFAKTLFICDRQDRPVATCASWKAYDEFYTIQWFKVIKEFEGRGIGRSLLSIVMRNLGISDYPIYLHTQPHSLLVFGRLSFIRILDFCYFLVINLVSEQTTWMNVCQFWRNL